MPCFHFKPDFITVLLQNNLIMLKLFVIILNCVGISDWSQHIRDVNAGLLMVYDQIFFGGEGVVDGGSSERCLEWGGGVVGVH